jgi:hypothetical protein
MAMVNLAMFEALNGIYGRYDRYHVTGSPSSGASGIAAASTAAHGVLVSIFASNAVQVSIFDSKLSSSLALIPSGVSLQAGIEWGTICGNDVLALRANDGSENIDPIRDTGSRRPPRTRWHYCRIGRTFCRSPCRRAWSCVHPVHHR